jgi:hypothetical protein
MCLVLPPVGSARSAILLLECIEEYTDSALFENPDIQIQVCSPGRLGKQFAGMLTLGFALCSDILRGGSLEALETTFSELDELTSGRMSRGRRITIHDGNGLLDKGFHWWRKDPRDGELRIRKNLPFKSERTDVLTCKSRIDIRNVNLFATLLTHLSRRGYWEDLGRRFAQEMKQLLQEHHLGACLDAPWVRTPHSEKGDDERFLAAFHEVMAYAIVEADRLQHARPSGILYEMHALREKYHNELITWSQKLKYGEVQ